MYRSGGSLHHLPGVRQNLDEDRLQVRFQLPKVHHLASFTGVRTDRFQSFVL